MRTFAETSKATQQASSHKATAQTRSDFGHRYEVNSILHLQRTIGNQAVQRLLQSNAEERNTLFTGSTSPHFWHGFSRIPVTTGPIQTKLAINKPGDEYEQEADRVAQQVMRMPEPKFQRACACGDTCPRCQSRQSSQAPKILQTKRAHASDKDQNLAPSFINEALTGTGQPLNRSMRDFMEPRFGHDFSQVRVPAGNQPAQSANSISARAYTVGANIVFNRGEYAPETRKGRQLLAHDLTHVIQQGRAGPSVHRGYVPGTGGTVDVTRATAASAVLQRATWEEVLSGLSEDEAAASIDQVLGSGAYDDWMTLEAAHDYEMKRARVNRARFSAFSESSGAMHLDFDADRVARAMLDLRDEMSNILTDTSVDKDRIDAIQSVLAMSIDLLEMDNDALDGAFAVGFAAALIAVPWLMIGKASRALEKELKKLRKELEKAEKEETEATIKAVLGGAITLATLLLPQVGLLARTSMSLGQVGLDFMLEGPEQSAVKEVGGKVGPIAEQVADGIADIETLSPGAKTVAKGASRGVSAVGLYFNVAEVGTAWKNVAEIKAAIERAERAHTHLAKVMKDNKGKYLAFMRKFGKAQDAIREVWDNAAELRSSLYDEMAATGYDP